MRWFDNNEGLMYGPKTKDALILAYGIDLCDYFIDQPLCVVHIIEKYNLMTPAITEELQDYIFVDV
jgi:hypothetical protein